MLGLGHIAKLKLSQPFDRFFILGYLVFIKLAHYCSACSIRGGYTFTKLNVAYWGPQILL